MRIHADPNPQSWAHTKSTSNTVRLSEASGSTRESRNPPRPPTLTEPLRGGSSSWFSSCTCANLKCKFFQTSLENNKSVSKDPDLKNASQKGMVDPNCTWKMVVIITWTEFKLTSWFCCAKLLSRRHKGWNPRGWLPPGCDKPEQILKLKN